MTGLLAAQGYHVAQGRVGKSLYRVNPGHHMRRSSLTERQRNSVPYIARYFGEKTKKKSWLCLEPHISVQ